MSKIIIFLLIIYPYISFSANDSGEIKMRARVEIWQQNSKNEISSVNTTNISAPLSDNKGLNISASYFFSEKVASEVTLGINKFKLCNAANIASFYGNINNNIDKKNSYSLPFSLGFQLYPIKINHFNLYAGGGYIYSWTSNNKYAKFNNFRGPFAQAGLDIYNKNNIGFNFDVKKYFPANNKIKYRRIGVNNLKIINNISSTPWIFSGGIIFKFGHDDN